MTCSCLIVALSLVSAEVAPRYAPGEVLAGIPRSYLTFPPGQLTAGEKR